MNPFTIIKIALVVSAFSAIMALVSHDSNQPTCKVAFHGNGTWDAIGWDPVFDGFNNCDLPDTWAGLPVTVKPNGTWAVK